MRVTTRANVVIADGTDNKDTIFGPDSDLAESVLDGQQEAISGRERLTVAGGAYTLPLSTINAPQGFFLRVSGDATVNINGLGEVNLERGITATGGVKATHARLLWEGSVSSVVVTPTEDGQLVWAVWGDPIV